MAHIIYFPVPKGRKHRTKARPKSTRANNKLCPMSRTLKGLDESAPPTLLYARHSSLGLITLPIGSRRWCLMVLASPTSAGSSSSQTSLFFFIWVLHTWTPHLYHSHNSNFSHVPFPPKLISYIIIIATYTTHTHTLTCVYDLLHAIIFAYIFMCPPTADHLGLDNLFGACPWRKLAYPFLRDNDHLSFFFKGWDHVKFLVCTACQLVMVLLWSFQEAILLRLMGAFSMLCLEDTIEQ